MQQENVSRLELQNWKSQIEDRLNFLIAQQKNFEQNMEVSSRTLRDETAKISQEAEISKTQISQLASTFASEKKERNLEHHAVIANRASLSTALQPTAIDQGVHAKQIVIEMPKVAGRRVSKVPSAENIPFDSTVEKRKAPSTEHQQSHTRPFIQADAPLPVWDSGMSKVMSKDYFPRSKKD